MHNENPHPYRNLSWKLMRTNDAGARRRRGEGRGYERLDEKITD